MENSTNAQQRNFDEILGVVIRRKELFLFPFIFIFVLTIVIGLFLPKTYETAALLQIKNEGIMDPLVSKLAVSPDVQNAIETVNKQITAWPKMEQLVTQLHMADNIKSPVELESFIKSMRSRIQIKLKNKDIIEVVYQDRSPAYAQQVTNTLTQNFIEENSRVRKEEARNAIEFIQSQLEIYRGKLDSSQKDFSTNKIESDLRLAQNKKIILNQRMASLQKITPSQVTTQEDPVAAQLKTRRGLLEAELAKLSLDSNEGNPRVAEIKEEIESIKAWLGSEMNSASVKESISTANPLYLQTEQELKSVEMEIDYLNKRKAEVDRIGKVTQKNVSEEDLANLERNKKVDDDVYQMLLRQLESAYVSERLEDSDKGNRFAVIEYARLPLLPVKPRMNQILIVGFLAGLAAGFGLVFMVEGFSGAFQTAEQVRETLGLHMLGSISKFAAAKNNNIISLSKIFEGRLTQLLRSNQLLSGLSFVKPHILKKVKDNSVSEQIVMYHEPNSVISEEYRVLRTHIFHKTGAEKLIKTITITSTLRGEGKSTTSSNLAVAIADDGRRTLLIDCDLRKGVTHELFSSPQSPGLAELLSGSAEVKNCVKSTIVKNLFIMTAGKRADRPAELLGSPKMTEVLDRLKNEFDCIILDSPPVINLTDASILSRYVDAVIMVLQAGRAKKNDVSISYNKLKQVDAKIAGFVLTNVEYYMPKYVYDYYYNYD